MRLDFKRIMSSVLAFVMLFSSLVMVNVVSVSAADKVTYDFGAGEWLENTTSKEIYTSSDGNLVVKHGDMSKDIKNAFKFDKNEQSSDLTKGLYCKINNLNVNDQVTVDVYYASNTPSKVALKLIPVVSDGTTAATSTGEVKDAQATKSSAGQIIFSKVEKAGAYYIITDTTSTGSAYYGTITITSDGSSSSSSTWTITDTETPVTGKVELQQVTGSDEAILRYTGEDNAYSVIPSRRIIKTKANGGQYVTDNEDGSHTLDLTGTNWEYYLTANINIPVGNIVITGGKNRALHLTCTPHDTVYTIKLDENGQAYAMIEEGENGGYTIPPEAAKTIPLHNGTLTASMVGGELEKDDSTALTQNFKVDSEESSFTATFKPYEINEVNATVARTDFNSYKVSSVIRGERLFGGTVLDPENRHFFVAAEKDKETDGVYTLTDPVALGTDIDMKAVVLRAPGSKTADGTVQDEQGIGFILADKTDDESDTNVTYTLKVYCTAVNQDTSISQDATETSIAIREIDKSSYAAVGSGYTESDTITVQDADHVLAPEDYVEFSGLKAGKAYAIFNPAGEDGEPQGNIRVYAMELTRTDKPISSGGLVWNADDLNGSDILGDAFKDKTGTTVTETSRKATFADEVFDTGDKHAIYNHKYVEFKGNATFVPSQNGTLKLWLTHNGSGSDSAKITDTNNDNAEVYKDGFASRSELNIPAIVIENVVAGHVYKFSNGGWLFKAELIPDGPAKATITGSVKETAKLEAKEHTNKTDLDKGEKNNNRVPYANNTETSGSVADKAVADAVVTITGDNLTGEQNAEVQANGSFSFDNGGDLKDGTYTVKAAKGGKTIGTKEITVTDGVANQKADFTLDNTVAVTLTTDIKDYKTAIVLTSGSNKITISDVTYHYIPSLASSKGDVARTESITHYFNAPAGTYSVAFSSTSDRFEIQDRSGKKLDSITIGENGVKSQTVRLYIAPKSPLSGSYTEKANSLQPVQKGIYRFIRQDNEEPTTVKAATIKFKSTDGEHSFVDDTEHMYAEGKYSAFKEGAEFTDGYVKGANDGRISVSDKSGYVVFKLDKGDSYIAKIKTSTATCVLERVDGDGTINGNRTVISVDSRFDTTAIPITGGAEGSTYVLASNTPSTSEANVESIEFDVASPFVVTKAQKLEDENLTNAQIVIGKFDMTGIDEDALNNYSTFAILVAEDQEALKWAALNGTVNGTKPSDKEEVKTSTADSSQVVGSSQKHETSGHVMDVIKDIRGTEVKVLRDDTKEVFKKILNDEGEPIVEGDGNYYYAVVVQNISTPLYAVGAAKSTDTGNWTVQGTPFTITAN